MNEWMQDARVRNAELAAFQAERAEKRGDVGHARVLYRRAAVDLTAVALSVPANHPRTRAALGEAAVASYARAGDVGEAIEIAQRLLVEPGALDEGGRRSLAELLGQLRQVQEQAMHAIERPAARPIRRTLGDERRAQVRSAARGEKHAA